MQAMLRHGIAFFADTCTSLRPDFEKIQRDVVMRRKIIFVRNFAEIFDTFAAKNS
jgi:hypothetical protein